MNLQEKKRDLIECIQDFLSSVKRLQEEKKKIDQNNQIARRFLSAFFKYDFENVAEGLRIHQKVVERENIKCVFVGKTSNGKSAVINSLLGDKVLKSYTYITTICFISIKGCVEDVEYILDENEQRTGLDILQRTIATTDDHFKADRILKLFYPEGRCPLLANKVELLDCPGIGAIEDYANLIENYCEDADIFVLVLDCISGLSRTEKDFFEVINKKFSKVNVIVLINKWDQMSLDDPIMFVKIKMKIESSVEEFLKQISNPYLNSIFFGSATTILDTEDQSLQTFKQFLFNASESPFEIKIGSRIMSMKEDISVIDKLHINERVDVSQNIKDDRMEDLFDKYFRNFESQAQNKIKEQTEGMLQQLRESVRSNTGIDSRLQLLFEEEFPAELSEIYSKPTEEIWKQIKDSLGRQNIQFDSKSAKTDFVELYNLQQIKVDYINEMKLQCRGLEKEMRSRLKEIESISNGIFNGLFHRLLDKKTEKVLQYENILKFFLNFYLDKSADVNKRLQQSFNAHRNQTRHIQSILNQESKKLLQIPLKLMGLFPVKIERQIGSLSSF